MEPLKARLFYYPTLIWNVARKSDARRWYDRVDENILIGALPFRSHANELVKQENVRGVVTMNENYETRFVSPNQQEWGALGVKQLRLSTVDFYQSPSVERVEEAINFIDDVNKDGCSVYVHCKAGRGRSATVVLCYIMKHYRYDPFHALQFLKTKRSHIKLCEAQQLTVNHYYKKLSENLEKQCNPQNAEE
ncbi:Phosphatidylglycerophosphatase and protein-tyrosine phosphatase 1 [Trichoplax sp. H2]|nr:Phosphatidylglycerophosphatase and protein-tyrosine phosphatase 1 [Trichoplax sp. H2]|eukprot:RDD44483.1 Phosphatidylglycerophosphatase and protein-tyrosine phosphatase 1 [Trichoplax sp. H2]